MLQLDAFIQRLNATVMSTYSRVFNTWFLASTPPHFVVSCFNCCVLRFCSPRQKITSRPIDLRPEEQRDAKELEAMEHVI